MSTNFEPKRLKPKLDIVEKPEHSSASRLTDSNVFHGNILPVMIGLQSPFHNVCFVTSEVAMTITVTISTTFSPPFHYSLCTVIYLKLVKDDLPPLSLYSD